MATCLAEDCLFAMCVFCEHLTVCVCASFPFGLGVGFDCISS